MPGKKRSSSPAAERIADSSPVQRNVCLKPFHVMDRRSKACPQVLPQADIVILVQWLLLCSRKWGKGGKWLGPLILGILTSWHGGSRFETKMEVASCTTNGSNTLQTNTQQGSKKWNCCAFSNRKPGSLWRTLQFKLSAPQPASQNQVASWGKFWFSLLLHTWCTSNSTPKSLPCNVSVSYT